MGESMLSSLVKSFLAVADCGSFSGAAGQLLVSKVSVMNQINALESQIGVRLFERTHHGVFLTEAGKSFYQNAKKLAFLSENAIREARKIGGAQSHTIRIGTSMMRPCNALVELWERGGAPSDYQFSIVAFNDDVDGLSAMLSSLGDKIDCFVTPCGSTKLLMNYSFLPFDTCKCVAAMSKKHPLAKKKVLSWQDFDGETLLLMRQGESYVLDEMRDDILQGHPNVRIVDFDGYYDMSTFNLCEQQGYLMETLDIWETLHPSLATVPVDWKYEIPYGILYAKDPSDTVREFISAVVAKME